MTGWKSQKPEIVGTLESAFPRFRTRSGRVLAEGYLDLMNANEGRIPAKNGLDLSPFARAIANFALAAITVPDKCVYRIAGEGFRRLFAANPTGRNYYDFVAPERRRSAAHAMNMVVAVPSAFRAEVVHRFDSGASLLIEAAGFPLTSEEPGVDGFVLFFDEPMERPALTEEQLGRLVETHVLRRDLIDLGFGVDETFVDLVPER